jgi:sodium transport system permease protein
LIRSSPAKRSKVGLIMVRELRDQLRDRRTMFMIAVLPLLLYPLLGMSFFHVAQFVKHHPSSVLLVLEGQLPPDPPLTEDSHFVPFRDHGRELVKVESLHAELPNSEKARWQAERLISQSKWDAVVVFSKPFCKHVTEYANGQEITKSHTQSAAHPLAPVIYFQGARERSRLAEQRVQEAVNIWRDTLTATRERRLLPEGTDVIVQKTEPAFPTIREDLSSAPRRRAAFWSKILPLVAFIWALTGAFYPAIDLCAGEKERGTLETLLCSAADRRDIVWGKMLTVMIFSLVTSLLNLACMVLTGTLVVKQVATGLSAELLGIAGPPPLIAIVWLTCLLVPISALFSCLATALSTLARSTREGQYYLMPLLLTFMPLMMFSMFPSARLDLGTSLIPVSGVLLFLRQVMEGDFASCWPYLFPVLGMTCFCCWASLRWAVDQFSNETILFRSGDRFDLKLWWQGLIRDRAPTPSVGEAMMCGLLIILIRFFAGLSLPFPQDWSQFALQTVVTLVAFVATPALLMAVMLTTRPTQTLLIQWTGYRPLIAAAILAVCLHPLATLLALFVRAIYPVSQDAIEPVAKLLAGAPSSWHLFLLMAVLPAICEELTFRGFILSGLRHLGKSWQAIGLASLFFGVAHGVIQQSLLAAIFGLVLGLIAIRSQSILPCIVFHAAHNALGIFAGNWLPQAAETFAHTPWLFYQFPGGADGPMVCYGLVFILPGVLFAFRILHWFNSLSYAMTIEERRQTAKTQQSMVDGAACS